MRFQLGLVALVAIAAGCSEPTAASMESLNGAPLIGVAAVTPPTACVADLTGNGTLPVCASCACGKCPAEADACGGDAACEAVIACMHDNNCHGDECYCGNSWACGILPTGPCRAEYRAAAGSSSLSTIRARMRARDNSLGRAEALAICTMDEEFCETQCTVVGEDCYFGDEACQERYCSFDQARENARTASAASTASPVITAIDVNGVRRWSTGQATGPTIRPGDRVALIGTGFGAGVNTDFAKIMIGNSRVLETTLNMYEQKLNILTEVMHEEDTIHSTWPTDLISWTNTKVEFRAPVHISEGPLRMQVQKRIGYNQSLLRHGEAHNVVDAMTLRIEDPDFNFTCDVVSELGLPRLSNAVPVVVQNPNFESLVRRGREIFWSYDYNIGLAHEFRGLDWTAIFAGETTDPITGQVADPLSQFGAYPTVAGEVPSEAIDDVYFDPYPMRSPIPGLLAIGKQFTKGNTRNSGFVGYRYAESNHPFAGRGEWIGFNCASCHGYRITHQNAQGQNITRVYPGLPNPRWTMRWSIFGEFEGVVDEEIGPSWAPGGAAIDKTTIVYAMPAGTGEHNVIRGSTEGSHTDNDYQFSPITIPNVTNHMPVRRSLAHTESYVGFEGSYVHSEEPDGAMGSMDAASLQAFTAYMTTLDENDPTLINVGVYRWLKSRGELTAAAGNITEGQMVANGWQSYPGIVSRVNAGKAIFEQRCGSCHTDGVTLNSNERMIRLDQVGHFFAPTIYQRHVQSVRVTYLRNMYWTQHRGLLTDGHVRNMEDLVNPDRCTEGTALYNRYYTLHAPQALPPMPDEPPMPPGMMQRGNGWRAIRSQGTSATAQARNRFVERHRYFVPVPWDPNFYYWDYQKFRREYGPHELGTAAPIGMPAAPHPWCAGSQAEVANLVLYTMTL